MVQRVKVIGRTVACNKCKQSADSYCACGTFLCSVHLITHRCLVQLRSTYSKEVLEALR